MARYVRRVWERVPDSITLRRERFPYLAFLPDPLAGWHPVFGEDVARRADRAVRHLAQANHRFAGSASSRLFLWGESLGSSRIEQVDSDLRNVARARAVQLRRGIHHYGRATRIITNLDATRRAVAFLERSEHIGLDDLLEAHVMLFSGGRSADGSGRIRTDQNWIGHHDGPYRARFVPPPPEQVVGLLDDLITYCNGYHHSPIIQAALAHGQFEVIHPFADGNGRIGRALVHAVLARRGLTDRFAPPISLYLSARKEDYIEALQGFAFECEPNDPARTRAAEALVEVFSDAAINSCETVVHYHRLLRSIQARWQAQVSARTRSKTVRSLLDAIAADPVMTVDRAAALAGASERRTRSALAFLEDSGVLRARKAKKAHGLLLWEADEVFDLLAVCERNIARPYLIPTEAGKVLRGPVARA